MIENGSSVSDARASAPAQVKQYRPDDLEGISVPSSDTPVTDPLRQQVNQLLSGPQGDFSIQGGFGPRGDFKIQGHIGPNGEIGLVGNFNDQNVDARAKFEIGKPGFQPHYETERRVLLDNIARLGDKSLGVYVTNAMLDAQSRVAKETLSKEELTGVLSQVNKLMTTDSALVSAKERVNIAACILHHTGEGRIDQGIHSTCNVTVLQNIAFDKRPSLAAEMITSAALTGEWKAGDGKVIKVPNGSLKPGWEEEHFPPKNGLRSHASQVFQVVALNDVGQREKEPVEYVQKHQSLSSLFFAIGQQYMPASEYLLPNGYEVWRDKRGVETNFNGLSGRQIQEESKRLFGDKHETIAFKSPYEWMSHPWSVGDDDYKGNKMVESEEGLRQALEKLDSEKKLPVVIAVNGDMIFGNFETSTFGLRALIRPIKTLHEYIDSKLGVANHVVIVTQFDKAQDRVYVKNSWGAKQDGWVSVKNLWKAV